MFAVPSPLSCFFPFLSSVPPTCPSPLSLPRWAWSRELSDKLTPIPTKVSRIPYHYSTQRGHAFNRSTRSRSQSLPMLISTFCFLATLMAHKHNSHLGPNFMHMSGTGTRALSSLLIFINPGRSPKVQIHLTCTTESKRNDRAGSWGYVPV
jgi:hypothetical protein